VPYEDRFAEGFFSINHGWLKEYIGLAEKDLETLKNPRETILQQGGLILLAVYEDQAIGSICLEKAKDKTLITKLGVAKAHRGKGLGTRLCLSIINEARKQGINELWLETSTQLQPAISLYKKLGFEDMNLETRSPLCNVLMRLSL